MSIAVRKVHAQFRLLLTGTPLQNNLHELYALLNYMYPEVFDTSEPFDTCFNLTNSVCDPEMLHKVYAEPSSHCKL